jgi:hypothetical protein
MTSAVPTVMAESEKSGIVTIRRDHSRDARERQVYARIDDEPNRVLMFGDTIVIEVAPGPHLLRTHNTLFWRRVPFSIQPGERVEFVLINGFIWSGMEGLLAFFAGAVPLRLSVERR